MFRDEQSFTPRPYVCAGGWRVCIGMIPTTLFQCVHSGHTQTIAKRQRFPTASKSLNPRAYLSLSLVTLRFLPLFLVNKSYNTLQKLDQPLFCMKMLVKPKLTSIRVLYQSYWMASIFIVATYAASLAEQRFVARDAAVPFGSLYGLVENTANYRWIFLRNSSVVWMMQVRTLTPSPI